MAVEKHIMELIDLGLPSGTKWASCNIGANKPTEYGDYFAWGDTSAKSNYVGRTCETYDLDIFSLKMDDYVNRRNVLSDNYDAATYIWGERWRIPSGEQAQELIDNCQWEWVINYENSGVNGRLGISKINGAKIFLPAAGYAQSSNHLMMGDNGGYWTGSPNMVASNRAWSIAFDSNVINVFDHGLRYYGYSIRPIYK
jgi:hypothetical protein